MLEIYIVRHGKTLFNEKDMVQGACDSPLTKEGIMQAKNVGKNMRDIPFDVALSSPSGRASDTCEYAIENRLPIKYDKRLKEVDFGYLEGEKNSELRKGKTGDFFDIDDEGWVKEGGENTRMVVSRIESFFDDLVNTYQDKKIIVATHGMWIALALKHKFGVTFFPQNCSVSKVNFENGNFIVEYVGNTEFRDGGK